MSVSIFSNMDILLLINKFFDTCICNGGYINSSSSIIISERCSTNYSMAIGGSTIPSSNNSYSIIIFSTELSSLYAQNIQFGSYSG